MCLVPGTCTGQARARPGLGAVLVCSFSLSELLCHLGQEGWVGGKSLFSPVCPEEASALGCAWHGQQLALGVAAMAPLGLLCSASSTCGEQKPWKLPETEQKGSGEGWGEPEPAGTQQVAPSMVTVPRGTTAKPPVPLLCQVRGELSGKPSWKVRPSSPCSTRASSAPGPWSRSWRSCR